MTLGGLFWADGRSTALWIRARRVGGGRPRLGNRAVLAYARYRDVCVHIRAEYVAARFGVTWVAWIVTPFVGAGIPWLFEFIAPNRTNFLAAISQLCFVSGVIGVLWTISSLAAVFMQQPLVPDKRLFQRLYSTTVSLNGS